MLLASSNILLVLLLDYSGTAQSLVRKSLVSPMAQILHLELAFLSNGCEHLFSTLPSLRSLLVGLSFMRSRRRVSTAVNDAWIVIVDVAELATLLSVADTLVVEGVYRMLLFFGPIKRHIIDNSFLLAELGSENRTEGCRTFDDVTAFFSGLCCLSLLLLLEDLLQLSVQFSAQRLPNLVLTH